MNEDVRIWAEENKTLVHEIAEKYFSGSFVIALTKAFMFADRTNTAKILETFGDYFDELYVLACRGVK